VGGVEACGSSMHARFATDLHHRQLAEHIGEAGDVREPRGKAAWEASQMNCIEPSLKRPKVSKSTVGACVEVQAMANYRR
jgi:hypothetical protein